MNRGSDIQEAVLVGNRVASMRPRFMNRGSQRHDLSERRLPAASMRPRFMNRGSNNASRPIRFAASSLQ